MPDDGSSYESDNVPMLNANDADILVYEVTFRDTIINIDYTNKTFTVANRTETITADSNTFIWMQIIINKSGPNEDVEMENSVSGSAKARPQNYLYTRDSVLQFSDLMIGYVVEVRANIIDPSTLIAGKIKVASCNYQEECIEFTDFLASVDTSLRTVTFNTQPWIGTLCLNTVLTGLDGEVLTLADFITGDHVYVKGKIIADDTLRVGKMSKIE